MTLSTPPPGNVSSASVAPTSTIRTRRAARARARWTPAKLLAVQLAFFVVCLGIYQWLVTILPRLSATLPTVPELAAAAVEMVADASFWQAVGYTLAAATIGLFISLSIGTVVGVLLSLHRNAWASARFVVDFMRTIPPLALVPIALLVLGVNLGMEVTLIVIAALWPVVLQVYYGIGTVEPGLLETARMYRMPLWRRILFVLLPAVSPPFATAVRLSATLSLLLAVGTEVITSSGGLGALISRNQQVGDTVDALVAIVATGLVGLGVNFALLFAQRRLLHWHYRTTRGRR